MTSCDESFPFPLLLKAYASEKREVKRVTLNHISTVMNITQFYKQVSGNPHFSGVLSTERSGVRRMERSGEVGRGLREVLRGEELRSEEKDKPCLRISCTALSLPQKNKATHSSTFHKTS